MCCGKGGIGLERSRPDPWCIKAKLVSAKYQPEDDAHQAKRRHAQCAEVERDDTLQASAHFLYRAARAFDPCRTHNAGYKPREAKKRQNDTENDKILHARLCSLGMDVIALRQNLYRTQGAAFRFTSIAKRISVRPK